VESKSFSEDIGGAKPMSEKAFYHRLTGQISEEAPGRTWATEAASFDAESITFYNREKTIQILIEKIESL
jgi:hypothetical protein